MQLLGFTLATKQPSMTAAALAGTIRERAGPGRLDELVAADRADRALAVRRGDRQRLGGDRRPRSRSTSCARRVTGQPFLDATTAKTTVDVVRSVRTRARSSSPRSPACCCGSRACSRAGSRTGSSTGACRRRSSTTARQAVRRRRAWLGCARFLEQQAAGFGGSVSLGVLLGMLRCSASSAILLLSSLRFRLAHQCKGAIINH